MNEKDRRIKELEKELRNANTAYEKNDKIH